MTPRQSEIVSLARVQGRVSVDDLAIRFDVTPQTIRKVWRRSKLGLRMAPEEIARLDTWMKAARLEGAPA